MKTTTILIDGRKSTDKDVFYDYLSRKFKFPDYFGRNLDALHDLLTSIGEKTEVEIRYEPSIVRNLGDYGKSIIEVFTDAAGKNKYLSLKID